FFPLSGIQRNCTLRNQGMPFGPQYSFVFGNTSGSTNTLQFWPAPKCPNSPYACRRRNVVWPASAPVPNNSNSNFVISSPYLVGVDDLTPKRDCLTLKYAFPLGANSSLKAGSFTGRTVSNQSGWACLN